MAEGHAAVHAARALLAKLGHGSLEQELVVVVGALARCPGRARVALDLQEAAELAHQAPVPPTASSGRDARHAPRSRTAVRREGLFLGPLARARACSRAASPSRTRRPRAARPSRASTSRGDRASRSAGVLFDHRAQLDRVGRRTSSSKPTMPMLQRRANLPSSSST